MCVVSANSEQSVQDDYAYNPRRPRIVCVLSASDRIRSNRRCRRQSQSTEIACVLSPSVVFNNA